MSIDSTEQIRRLQRDLRSLKFVLLLGLAAVCGVGAVEAQVRAATRLEANSILFRRSDGTTVAELRVEDGNQSYDLSIRDAKGVMRLSLSGLTGENIPPYTAVRIHDPNGHEKITLTADGKSAGMGISASSPVIEVSDDVSRSLGRVSLSVEGERGSLTFFDKDSKRILSIPNN